MIPFCVHCLLRGRMNTDAALLYDELNMSVAIFKTRPASHGDEHEIVIGEFAGGGTQPDALVRVNGIVSKMQISRLRLLPH